MLRRTKEKLTRNYEGARFVAEKHLMTDLRSTVSVLCSVQVPAPACHGVHVQKHYHCWNWGEALAAPSITACKSVLLQSRSWLFKIMCHLSIPATTSVYQPWIPMRECCGLISSSTVCHQSILRHMSSALCPWFSHLSGGE